MAGIVRLFGHAAGGRPSERLLARLGMSVGAHNADFSILLDAVSRPHMQHRRVPHRVKQSLISGNMTFWLGSRRWIVSMPSDHPASPGRSDRRTPGIGIDQLIA
jgi:hypothetical protein